MALGSIYVGIYKKLWDTCYYASNTNLPLENYCALGHRRLCSSTAKRASAFTRNHVAFHLSDARFRERINVGD